MIICSLSCLQLTKSYLKAFSAHVTIGLIIDREVGAVDLQNVLWSKY